MQIFKLEVIEKDGTIDVSCKSLRLNFSVKSNMSIYCPLPEDDGYSKLERRYAQAVHLCVHLSTDKEATILLGSKLRAALQKASGKNLKGFEKYLTTLINKIVKTSNKLRGMTIDVEEFDDMKNSKKQLTEYGKSFIQRLLDKEVTGTEIAKVLSVHPATVSKINTTSNAA